MTTKTATPERTKHTKLSDASLVQKGDVWSRHSYGKVINKTFNSIRIENEYGLQWDIEDQLFEREFVVAEQFTSTKQVTRSELQNIVMSAQKTAISIFFYKKAEHKVLVDGVMDLLSLLKKEQKEITRRQVSSRMKELTTGEERVLVGRHWGQMDSHGRLMFKDMNDPSSNFKTVDPRTIEWAIINQVKYEVK